MFPSAILIVAGLALAFSVSAREQFGSAEPPFMEKSLRSHTGVSDASLERLVQQAVMDKVETEARDIRKKMPDSLANQLVESSSNETIQIQTESFSDNQPIPLRYSAYGENISPQLNWSEAPETTRSFVLIMEDPDAPQPQPFVHWIAYNIPAQVTSLRENLPKQAELEEPQIMQGQNSRGSAGYFGPRPPDDEPHHYHFQIFALDTMLDLQPGANSQDVVEAMKGHVLAMDEIVGTFEKPRID